MQNTIYKHLFFDLDRTLWDFEQNSAKVLSDIFEINKLNQYISSFNLFYITYNQINDKLWDAYRRGDIVKEIVRTRRFEMTLEELGIFDKELAGTINNYYLTESPRQKILFPNTIEILKYLQGKYSMHVLTNGFEEVQHVKLKNCGLTPYFDKVITSEKVGVLKPNPQIFKYALTETGAKSQETLMIGDDLLTDISGARNSDIDQVYFNPKKTKHDENVTFEINNLSELTDIL